MRSTVGVGRGWLSALGIPLRYLVPVFCFAFGVLLLLFVNSPTDGMWQLYAHEMLSGKKLYSDLEFNQEPLFPIIVMMYVSLAGGSLIAEKLIFIPEIALYVYLIYRLCRLSQGNWIETSILMLAVYFTAMHFTWFKFDDYHVVAQIGVLASILCTAKFIQDELGTLRFAAAQALITSLVFFTRPTEGMAVVAAVATTLLGKERRPAVLLRSIATAIGVVAVVFAVMMFAVGDSPRAWFEMTVLAAPSAKGGGLMLHYPAKLFENAAEFLNPPYPLEALALVVPIPLFLGALFALRTRKPWPSVILLCLMVYPIPYLLLVYTGDPVRNLTPICLYVVSACSAYVAFKAVASDDEGIKRLFHSNFPLVIYPFFIFLCSALSSGGVFVGLYFPVALTLAIVPMIKVGGAPLLRRDRGLRVGYYTSCLLVGISALTYRYSNPYQWLSYYAVPFFQDQHVVRNNEGDRYIASTMLTNLINPVCERVGSNASLLSLPYSAANYYCGIRPWHSYVQTFYDTSTPATIKELVVALQSSPPDYIFYQRQPYFLRYHEIDFQGGKPLPHRELDRLIMRKVEQGRWKIVYTSRAYLRSEWLLIKTHD